MSDKPRRPPVRIRFKYNLETGEVEELLIDDNAPLSSEDYHDQVARAVAGALMRGCDVQDAGPREALDREAKRDVKPGVPEAREKQQPQTEET